MFISLAAAQIVDIAIALAQCVLHCWQSVRQC